MVEWAHARRSQCDPRAHAEPTGDGGALTPVGFVALLAAATWPVIGVAHVVTVLRRASGASHARRTRLAAVAVATAASVVVAISLGAALATSDDGTLQAGANWARNQGFGWVVDPLERWHYAKPPSDVPAAALPIAVTTTTPSTTIEIPGNGATTTAPDSPTTTTTFQPEPLVPVVDTPLPGEGEWVSLAVPGGDDALWVTSMRPLARARSVTATYVRIRHDRLVAKMYAGTELPGGTGWNDYARVRDADLLSVVAAFNGGFRFEHIEGGYMSEGRVVEPLAEGEATIAIDRAGHITIGEYGRDLRDDGTWVSMRQGHPLLVDGGVSMADTRYSAAWGVNYGSETFTLRAALCQLDGNDLMYVIAGDVDAAMLGEVLANAGCRTAMQLDINGTWPQFAYYDGLGTSERTPLLVDSRMANPYRYLNGSKKDFFALFVADIAA